jgi:hypothetical protein
MDGFSLAPMATASFFLLLVSAMGMGLFMLAPKVTIGRVR